LDIDRFAALVFPSKEKVGLWWKQKGVNVPDEERLKR
jgi:hypothetical protein